MDSYLSMACLAAHYTVRAARGMGVSPALRSLVAKATVSPFMWAVLMFTSRNTVAKYADMEDMPPAAPAPAPRGRPALEGNGAWVESVLEADAGGPRKQRHTARRIYDRLVEERGFEGPYSTVRRFVRDWRLEVYRASPARVSARAALI